MPDETASAQGNPAKPANGYIFDVDDSPTNVLVENGQIKLASMF